MADNNVDDKRWSIDGHKDVVKVDKSINGYEWSIQSNQEVTAQIAEQTVDARMIEKHLL